MVNLYALSSVGTIVEQLFGSTRMLGIYLASGIAGNALGLFMQVFSSFLQFLFVFFNFFCLLVGWLWDDRMLHAFIASDR